MVLVRELFFWRVLVRVGGQGQRPQHCDLWGRWPRSGRAGRSLEGRGGRGGSRSLEGGGKGGQGLGPGGGRARSIFCVFGCICVVLHKREKHLVFLLGEGGGGGAGPRSVEVRGGGLVGGRGGREG